MVQDVPVVVSPVGLLLVEPGDPGRLREPFPLLSLLASIAVELARLRAQLIPLLERQPVAFGERLQVRILAAALLLSLVSVHGSPGVCQGERAEADAV